MIAIDRRDPRPWPEATRCARSARRQTVRARCSNAPAGQPPGRMNRRSGGRSALEPSIAPSSRVTSSTSIAAFSTRAGNPVRGIGEHGAEREQDRAESASQYLVDVGAGRVRADEAQPGIQLVDVAVGLDTRGSAFDTRVPSNSPVSPSSPVLV